MTRSYRQFGSLALFTLLFASCKPEEIPVPVDTTMESTITPVQLPIVSNVYGAMYSLRVIQTVNGISTSSEQASAVFYNNPTSTNNTENIASAGYVAVNDFALNQGSNNGYDRTATEGHIFEDLNYDEGVTWYVQGDDGIPPVTIALTSKFPKYSGQFPSVINRRKGLTLTFNENTLLYVDSVFVAISAGDKLIVKRYGANAGTIQIPSEELLNLQRCPGAKPGYLQITPASIDILNLSGRPTALIKQQAEIRTVIIE